MNDEPDLLNAAYQALDVERVLVAQLRRQAEIDTAALNECKALADDLAECLEEGHDDPVWVGGVLARYREARK